MTAWLHDSQALFTINQLLTSFSPHQAAQRTAISVWNPLLSCCHLLTRVPARQFADNGFWQWPLVVTWQCQWLLLLQLLAWSLHAIDQHHLLQQEHFSLSRNTDIKTEMWAGYSHHSLHGPCTYSGPTGSRFINNTKCTSHKSPKKFNFAFMLKAL